MNPIKVPLPYGSANHSQHGENGSQGILTERDLHIARSVVHWLAIVQGHDGPTNKRADYYRKWLPGEPDLMKSRLFWRIRAGYKILKAAPPTAYSCPWYELIEEDRPHTCWDDFHLFEGQVSIAQCRYELPIFDFKESKGVARFGPYLFNVWKAPCQQREGKMSWYVQREVPKTKTSTWKALTKIMKASIPIDHLPPDVRCMVGAFWSRSTVPIEERLPELTDKDGLDKIRARLKQFYIGYSHDSIGAMGETAIALEGISIFAAKAVEDTPLFRGQESSTRYIDLNLGMVDIQDMAEFVSDARFGSMLDSRAEGWMALYREALEKLPHVVKDTQYSMVSKLLRDGHTEEEIDKAIGPYCFDIARGLLPIATKTSMIWVGDFQTINQHLDWLLCHPVSEVRNVGLAAWNAAYDKYPQAIQPLESRQDRVLWMLCEPNLYYPKPKRNASWKAEEVALETLTLRPKRGRVPHSMYNDFTISGLYQCMDYAGWRDIQRHRYGVCQLTAFGNELHPFYKRHLHGYLGLDFLAKVEALEQQMGDPIECYDHTDRLAEVYARPIGITCDFRYEYGLPQAVYIAELRSSETVHPTVRQFVNSEVLPPLKTLGVKVHVDKVETEHVFSVKRGKQTIYEKGI